MTLQEEATGSSLRFTSQSAQGKALSLGCYKASRCAALNQGDTGLTLVQLITPAQAFPPLPTKPEGPNGTHLGAPFSACISGWGTQMELAGTRTEAAGQDPCAWEGRRKKLEKKLEPTSTKDSSETFRSIGERGGWASFPGAEALLVLWHF